MVDETHADDCTQHFQTFISTIMSTEDAPGLPTDPEVADSAHVDEENLKEKMKERDNTQANYDNIEHDLGISEYMSPSVQGFSAVVKARYSDFLVHEVRLDGVMAKLTCRDIPGADRPAETEATTVKSKENISAPVSSDEVWKSLESKLTEMINDADCAQKVMTLLTAHNERRPCEDKYITLPALDKEQRRSIHNWIRESLYCARADTLNDRIRIWHVMFEKEMPNYEAFSKTPKRGHDNRNQQPNSKRNKRSWPEDRPEFLQFVLYKENMDTTTAAKELSRKGSKARIGFAGMKDKRGVTAQFCTMQHTEPQQILGHHQNGGGNSKLNGNAVVQIGNFEYVSKEMRLGTLKGNRFDLVLRNVLTGSDDEETSKELLQTAADSMKASGFINYFGTQRFGKYQDTHLVGDNNCCQTSGQVHGHVSDSSFYLPR